MGLSHPDQARSVVDFYFPAPEFVEDFSLQSIEYVGCYRLALFRQWVCLSLQFPFDQVPYEVVVVALQELHENPPARSLVCGSREDVVAN